MCTHATCETCHEEALQPYVEARSELGAATDRASRLVLECEEHELGLAALGAVLLLVNGAARAVLAMRASSGVSPAKVSTSLRRVQRGRTTTQRARHGQAACAH
jgi:hypothetical protein